MKTNKGVLVFHQSSIDLSFISSLLEAEECTVFVTSRPLEALHILRNNDIDVIMASSRLDGMDGGEFKALAEQIHPGVSVFLLTFPHEHGPVTDCTLNMEEFVQFIRNHAIVQCQLTDDAARFKKFFFSFTDRLLQIFDAKDKYFFNNNHLVAALCRKVAVRMDLEKDLVDAISLATLLRDLGKIVIENAILNESGRLENNAIAAIKSHPINSVQLLSQIDFPWNVESIIRHHHEHYNGKGYPAGLVGRHIPIGSRIIAVVDSYVAMTTDRPYRKAKRRKDAIDELVRLAGTQFDPEIVEVFFAILQSEEELKENVRPLLMVNRDPATSSFIQLNLDSEEFALEIVADRQSAFAAIERRRPDLIICDDEILQGEEISLCRSLKESEGTKAIPLIVLTGEDGEQPEYADESVCLVPKPLDLGLFRSRVDSLLKGIRPAKAVASPHVENKGVSGNLEDMGFTDIVQILHMGVKTATVVLKRNKETAVVNIRNGSVVAARMGALTGKEAFFALLTWEEGEFRILHGKETMETNITMDTMNLLLESARVMDERNHQKGEGDKG